MPPRMKTIFAVAAVYLCFFTILCVSQDTLSRKAKRPKPKKPVSCPDTCALKRRIGKVEIRFHDQLAQTNISCESKIDSLRNEILAGGTNDDHTTTSDGGGLNSLKSEILGVVDEKLDTTSDELRGYIDEQYDLLKGALSKVTNSPAEPSGQSNDRESTEREINLENAVRLLNLTVFSISRQNAELVLQTQELRSQTAALRAQNEALASDNQVLRRLDHQQKILSADKDRVLDVEDKLSVHNTRLNTIDSKMEWLTARVNDLADVADRAQTESASAADKANRASQLARKAMAVARRQPAPTSSDGEEVPSVGLPQPEVPPSDCQELYRNGYNVSGVYRIRPWRSPEVFEVYCEQRYRGGGWTLIQRRRDGSVDFDRDWNSYLTGFGDPDGETWLGNRNIHFLTNQDAYTLQVLLLDWEGNRASAEYEGFRIQSNVDNFALQFGRYVRGSAGNALSGTTEDGSRNAYLSEFTTLDVDNDNCSPCVIDRNSFENCAELQRGGWWFRACSDSNLNGRYIQPQNFPACGDEGCHGIRWRSWRGDPNYSLKASMMLVRRAG